MYSTIAHTSPHIPNVAPSYGVPNDVFTDLHRMQNPNQPSVNNLRTTAMQSQLSARNELAQFKEDIANMMKNKLSVDMGNSRLYQKPYRGDFDYVALPPGWRMPDFVKFSGDGNCTTWEHINQYTAQLVEAGTFNSLKVRLFSLSLTCTAFAWFSSLAPNSIDSWDQLEQKFHDHFFSGSYQLKLTDLTPVRQNKEESVSDYLKCFKEVKNWCFNLSLTDSDLAGLAAKGLTPAIRDRLEDAEFHTLANVLVSGMAQELKLSKEKEHSKPRRSNVHVVEYDSDSADDENEVCVAEFVWPSKSKASFCASLKPATKGRQQELKVTFDVSKCDRIFHELLKLGNIKISYTMPALDEIKRRAYCKFHNSYSHSTNDCNVFRRQIQSAINEGRLMLHEMQVDKQPFPINTMELQQPKVLVRLHQAEASKGKNVMVREAKPDLRGKELTREVALEKTPDGRETFKITVKASGHEGKGSSTPSGQQTTESVLDRAVRPGVQAVRPPLHMAAQRCLFRSGPR
jgi:hypothetical protein